MARGKCNINVAPQWLNIYVEVAGKTTGDPLGPALGLPERKKKAGHINLALQ